MNLPAFPTIANGTVAPPPSAIWGSLGKAPLPTNAPWMNFVLNNTQQAPEVVLPYSVRPQAANATSSAGIGFGVPVRTVQPAFIIQAFVADLLLTTLEGLLDHRVVAHDDLSVTLSWNSSATGENVLTCPLVRGSPYLTFIFSSPGTPVFRTQHAIVGFDANPGRTKYRVSFNNNQTWLIYASSPLSLTRSLRSAAPFAGVIRVALLPAMDTGAAESLLDAHAPVYPTGGNASIARYQIEYNYTTVSWSPAVSATSLLMLTLPVHRRLCVQSSPFPLAAPPPSSLCTPYYGSPLQSSRALSLVPLQYSSLDGEAQGTVGAFWRMQVDLLPATWHSMNGINPATDPATLAALKASLVEDVANLTTITTASTYFFGKAAARAARLGLIAEELQMPDQVQAVSAFLEEALTPWFSGTFPGNAFLYDSTWGSVVSRNGAADQGADFGLAFMNDHHFHYGYYIYAAAVLAKFNVTWARSFQPQVYTLLRDYMTLQADDQFFPRLRHFDFYALHSWASGLFVFADGRNQESSSEAVNAYYAAALAGFAFNDLNLAVAGATLAAVETIATETLWHMPSNTSIYADPFADANRVMGVVWSNKRDAGLWFASAESKEMRTGIQMLPVTPYTNILFRNRDYALQLFNWTLPALALPNVTDQWKGFSWALQALNDPTGALQNVQSLTAHDDGNSRTNLLWFVLTQQQGFSPPTR